uniref:(northern house mosquito) hypothetical protein n=1 Tax=Culex pipiens TaxID=7175 RepID=A0A8D8JP30_CULPI
MEETRKASAGARTDRISTDPNCTSSAAYGQSLRHTGRLETERKLTAHPVQRYGSRRAAHWPTHQPTRELTRTTMSGAQAASTTSGLLRQSSNNSKPTMAHGPHLTTAGGARSEARRTTHWSSTRSADYGGRH